MFSALFHTSRKMRRFAFSDTLPKLMPDIADYMTTKEAADELGFTTRGIHMLIKKEKLGAVSSLSL